MGIGDKLKELQVIKDFLLYQKYGNNIHDIDYSETIQTGIVKRLMGARDLGVPYCVVFGRVIPVGKSWDKFGDGTWNPPRDYITTDDIATPDNDRDQELRNIFDFLRGKKMELEAEDEAKHTL